MNLSADRGFTARSRDLGVALLFPISLALSCCCHQLGAADRRDTRLDEGYSFPIHYRDTPTDPAEPAPHPWAKPAPPPEVKKRNVEPRTEPSAVPSASISTRQRNFFNASSQPRHAPKSHGPNGPKEPTQPLFRWFERPGKITEKTAPVAANPTASPTAPATRVALKKPGPVASAPEKPADKPLPTISSGDVLDILCWEQPDIGGTLAPESDTRYTMTLVGSLQLVGLRLNEAATLIENKLSPYLRSPTVLVLKHEATHSDILILDLAGHARRLPASTPGDQLFTENTSSDFSVLLLPQGFAGRGKLWLPLEEFHARPFTLGAGSVVCAVPEATSPKDLASIVRLNWYRSLAAGN